MATYRVVHGTMFQGGQPVGYGGAVELSAEEAEHVNKHGEKVLTEADFEKHEQAKALTKELAASKESARIAGKRKKVKAPEPEPESDEAEEETPEADEPEAAPTPPAAPVAKAAKPAKKAKGKKS